MREREGREREGEREGEGGLGTANGNCILMTQFKLPSTLDSKLKF